MSFLQYLPIIRPYIEINRKFILKSRRPPNIMADPSSVNPPQHEHYQ